MTITELRIGNLVYTDRMIDNELVVVNTISYNPDKKDYLLSISHFPYLTISQCKPIPLTEEWLVRFGFELYGEKEYHGNGSYPILVWDDGFWLDDNETGTINDKPILYVHQLQNIHFVLTGEELVCK